MLLSVPPLSLYVHFPWCESKCPYCDFNSHGLRGPLPEADYVDTLLVDLERELQATAPRPIETVFFGGGTPSLIDPSQIARLLARLQERGRLATDAEITLEANPGSLERARFSAYRSAGINRLSIGVQSFDDTALRALGRIHDAAAARRAIEGAREAGFERINIDLMYGLPGQGVAAAIRDVRVACELDPGHVSHYQLTLEPGTVFHRYPPELPAPDQCWTMLHETTAVLRDAGYRRYEVSALARPGHRCRHNLNYWLFGDYIGIGAGAHGKLTHRGRIQRSARPRSPSHYQQGVAAASALTRREVGAADAAFEFMLNALRLSGGFPLALFSERTGQPLATVGAALRQAEAKKLIEVSGDWIRPTVRGGRFLDDLQALFLPAEAPGPRTGTYR